MRILVTGATGYIGGRLVPRLLDAGHEVVVLSRRPVVGKPWADRVQVVIGDATDPKVLDRAMADVQVAYYLLHSLSNEPGFAALEKDMASHFAAAAGRAQLERIIYLGGLAPTEEPLSEHLSSRRVVGDILRAGPVPCVELRAGVVIGSGSASFEMLRYLTERLPIMTTPSWVRTRTQPIAVADVLEYLVRCLDLPSDVNRAFDIGGPDVLTYEDMMQKFAEVANLRPRVIVPVPVLSPGLSSHWVGLITPVPASIARPLVASLKVEVVRKEHDLDELVGKWDLLPFSQAVSRALAKVNLDEVDSSWSDRSWPGSPDQPWPGDPAWTGGSLHKDVRVRKVATSPEQVFKVLEGIGGSQGWYSWPLAWKVRGALDRAVGGVGLRRGRKNSAHLSEGDAVDFWRVEKLVPGQLLRLRAEMRLPGLAWLEWELKPVEGGTLVRQRALFHPRGLLGHAYWWGVAPFHSLVFAPMLDAICAQAASTGA